MWIRSAKVSVICFFISRFGYSWSFLASNKILGFLFDSMDSWNIKTSPRKFNDDWWQSEKRRRNFARGAIWRRRKAFARWQQQRCSVPDAIVVEVDGDFRGVWRKCSATDHRHQTTRQVCKGRFELIFSFKCSFKYRLSGGTLAYTQLFGNAFRICIREQAESPSCALDTCLAAYLAQLFDNLLRTREAID